MASQRQRTYYLVVQIQRHDRQQARREERRHHGEHEQDAAHAQRAHEQPLPAVGQHQVEVAEVLAEAVEHAPRGRGVEERQRRAQRRARQLAVQRARGRHAEECQCEGAGELRQEVARGDRAVPVVVV